MSKQKESRFVIVPSKNKNDKSANISLKGDLSLKWIDSLKISFNQVLNDFNSFHVTIESVENIDLGFIQLIKAFANTVVTQGKSIKIEFDLKDEHKELLENAGLHEFISKN